MLGRLHVIVNVRPDRDPLALTRAVLDGGAPVVQLRAKGLTDRELYDLACRVVELCSARGATCVVNDRADVAVAAGAAGVHVGEHDLPVAVARRVVGDGAVVGGTGRDAATAAAHQRDGATYVGVGPVYTTTTKVGLPDPVGIGAVAATVEAVGIPVIAIAGITLERVPEVMAAGAYGVAVIGAVAEADDPQRATADLVAAVERGAQ